MSELDILRHSCSHVMAHAVTKLFPGAKVAIGPAIEDGFYYDFEREVAFTPEDLPRIEREMRILIDRNLPFIREEWPKQRALRFFSDRGEIYKTELIEQVPGETVSIYKSGDDGFIDLCKGPHIAASGAIKAFKLLSIAGAYWRGDARNKMLQRIYGTCFASESELAAFLNRREEAQKRDHRKLGVELEYFSLSPEMGAGIVLYHPKGAWVRSIIEDYEKVEHRRRGYQMIISPHIMKSDIWMRSGHYDYYKENMYVFSVEGQEYAIKPMNCPGHIMVYQSRVRSYKELPLRLFEMGTVYRNEKSGVLHGLLRVRGFTQDDAHIFCTEEQLTDEISAIISFASDTMKVFGFEQWQVELSTRPEKSIGSDDAWEKATDALRKSLGSHQLAYEVNEGDGAFYGPKIDIKLTDALGRAWQCATIQCDFALPERFDLMYAAADGTLKRPIMLHRVLLGSLERFMGALIEHYAGALPLWLSPVQVKVLAMSDAQHDYVRAIAAQLTEADVRVETDLRNEKIGAKIRDAVLQKIPYLVVVGDKEMSAGTIAVRSERGPLKGKTEYNIAPVAFRDRVSAEVKARNVS